MSFLIPYAILLFIGIAVFYMVVEIALALGDKGNHWWFKYVVAVGIFILLGAIELYFTTGIFQ